MGSLIRDCPHCGKRDVYFRAFGVQAVEEVGRNPAHELVALRCNACSGGIFAHAVRVRGDNVLQRQGHNMEPDYAIGETYPVPRAADCPRDVPESIQKIVIEARSNLLDGRFMSAGAMIRRAIDVAMKQPPLEAGGGTLEKRIDKLHEGGLITAPMKDWAHAIRLDGNAAVHDVPEVTREEAEEMDAFLEAFLRYVFTLPALVERRKRSKR